MRTGSRVALPRTFLAAIRSRAVAGGASARGASRATTLVALLALLVPCPAAAPAAAAEGAAASIDGAGSGTLTGAVLTDRGLGIPGATVTLVRRATGRPIVVRTGERGIFRAGDLETGEWEITAEAPGFLPSSGSIEIGAGGAAVELRLTPSSFEESLTVTASAPRDSLESAEILESPARDLGEALAGTPGVWALRKGGIANEIVVHGLQSRDLSVLIDGQRVYGACPNHMDPPAFHVDFAEVDRVEVGKGPFDVRNQGSLGGVVNVLTRRPEPGFSATPVLAAGSWGYVNPSAVIERGGERVSFLAGGSYRASGAYRDGSGARITEGGNYAPSAIDEEAFRIRSGWARTTLQPSEGHAIHVSVARQEADRILYPYLLMDAEEDDTGRAGITYEFAGDGALRGFTAQAYATHVDHFMTDALRTSAAGAARDWSMGSRAETDTAGGRLEARWSRIVAGVEAYRRSWDVATYLAGMGYRPQHAIPGADVIVGGIYAEAEAPLSPAWTLRAGARFDRAESEADAGIAPTDLYAAYHGTRDTARGFALPSGNVRFVRSDANGLSIAFGVGHAARVPEPSESFFGLKRMGSDWVGDPDLDATRSTGADVTVALRRSGLSIAGSLFGQRLDGAITVHDQPRLHAVPGVGNTIARSYVNNDASLAGAELSVALSATDRIALAADLSWVRGRQERNPGERILSRDLAETPPLRFRSSIRFNGATWFLEGEGVLSARQGNVDTDLLEEPTPAWGVLNLRGGIRRGALALNAGVTNVFDRRYAEHLSYLRDPYRSGTRVYEPGRGVFGNVGWQF